MSRADLSDLVDLIYAAALGEDQAWKTFLETLRDAVDGCQAAVFIQGLEGAPSRMLSLGDPEHDRAYGEHYGAVNPWFTQGAHLIRPGAVVTTDWFSASELQRTEFYADWLQPQDMFHAVNGYLFEGAGNVGNVSVAKSWSKGSFRSDDLRLFERLTPHLKRALAIQRRLGAPTPGTNLADWIERLPYAVLLLDTCGLVTSKNRAADEIIARRVGLGLGARGELHLSRTDQNAELSKLIALATDPGGLDEAPSGGFLAFRPPDDGRPFGLTVSPIRGRLLAFDGQALGALVMIADPDSRSGPDRQDLARLYGLTSREAELAELLALGVKLNDAAAKMGVKRDAVHTHLAHVMQKTDTHRQAELLRLLLIGCPPRQNGPSRQGST